MAIKQTKEVALADVTSLPIKGTVSLDVLTRLRELKFPHPSSENCILVFEPFLNGPEGTKQEDVTISFTAELQEQQPPEDALDPETGEVLVAAGSERSRIPSVAELHVMPLPEGPQTITTFGDLFNVARRQLYLAMIGLMPQWADGVEDE